MLAAERMRPMRRLALLALSVCALAVAAAPASASSISWFKTPSKNIYCAWFHEAGSKQFLRCDVGELAHKAPKPHGCPVRLGWLIRNECERARVGTMRVRLGARQAGEDARVREDAQ